MTRVARGAWKAHSGDTLTAKQAEWVKRVRDAAKQRPRSKSAAALYLGVTSDTLTKWLFFFTGETKKWPVEIDPRFDAMRVVEAENYHKEKSPAASPKECARARLKVEEWVRKMEQTYSALAMRAGVPEMQMRSLMEQGEMSIYSMQLLDRAFRGRKIWVPSMLTDAEIEARKQAVERERREREYALLEQERIRYKLVRQSKPLSWMIV